MCAHDRLAETIVVDERKKARRQETAEKPPDLPVSCEDPGESQNRLCGTDPGEGKELPFQSGSALQDASHPTSDRLP
jgi:hypothetical protein